MSITVQYMGILAEKAGKPGETLETDGIKSSVMNYIIEKYPAFSDISFVVSHNGVITHGEAEIKKGDQVTLIPPAPGG